MDVTLKDFQPINSWQPDSKGPKWRGGEPEHLIDLTTGRRYWNEPKSVVGMKAFLLAVGTPVVHTIAAVVNIAYRTLKLASGSHFWMEKSQEKTYDFNARLKDAGEDLLRIATAPLAAVGLELSALYGIINPYDGRKLYATIERAQYGQFILAPCFQPDPTLHALGGNPRERGAF